MCTHQRPLYVCSACFILFIWYRYNIMISWPHSTYPLIAHRPRLPFCCGGYHKFVIRGVCLSVCVRLVTCCPFFVRVCLAAEECVVAAITVVHCVYHTDLYYIHRVRVCWWRICNGSQPCEDDSVSFVEDVHTSYATRTLVHVYVCVC